jgi:trehalose/maltose hydrolase-like predicted phosphorylase
VGPSAEYACSYSLSNRHTTLSNGYLGSRNDEERSEMRYVMRIAEFSESSNL